MTPVLGYVLGLTLINGAHVLRVTIEGGQATGVEYRMPDGSVNLLVHSMKRFRTRRVLGGTSLIGEVVYRPSGAGRASERMVPTDHAGREVLAHIRGLDALQAPESYAREVIDSILQGSAPEELGITIDD